jgi:hypothetical protein
VRRLVATKNAVLEDIQRQSREASWQSGTLWAWPEIETLRDRLRESSGRAIDACRRNGVDPSDLPGPSRRAFQLLAFLAAPGRLEAHLTTLERLQRVDERVQPTLDHAGHLYRFERDGSGIRLDVSEGFIGAPEEVLASLVRLAVPYTRKGIPRQIVRRYAEGRAFSQAMLDLEGSGGAYRSRPEGRVYDLAEIFESVNERYFDGRLDAPRLVWSDRPTFREFGHFEPATDTVQISQTLDSEGVPAFVVEHVMHHELLHRVIGAEERGGRRRYHSARFRRAERAFRRYQEAEDFLKRLSETSGLRSPEYRDPVR